ncbi:MAG: hypothetical protein ABI587_03175 [Gemmatimonadales bacterium]
MKVEIAPAAPPQLPVLELSSNIVSHMPEPLPRAISLAFAPLHKRAFGLAVGLAAGLSLLLATWIYLLRGPYPGENLALLSYYFTGYTVTWAGSFIGFCWGVGTGFVAGWFFAFCRNFVLALSIFWIRTRAEMAQSRDFLDHI